MESRKRRTGWLHGSPLIGGATWVALLGASWVGIAPLGIIEILFLLAPLAITPLGFVLVDQRPTVGMARSLRDGARSLQPLAAALVVAAFLSPPGPVAASLVVGWVAVAGIVAIAGLIDFLKGGFRLPEEWCFAAGQLFLPLGALGLLSSRQGAMPFGFQEPLVLLFAVHYHYAGFAVPLAAGSAGRALYMLQSPRQRLFPLVAAGVIGGPPLIAVGFLSWRALIITGVFLLAASLILFAGLLLHLLPKTKSKTVKLLLAVSAGSLAVSMVLACVYSVGEFAGNSILDVHRMAWVHGVLNALGFSLCGLVGSHFLLRELPLWIRRHS